MYLYQRMSCCKDFLGNFIQSFQHSFHWSLFELSSRIFQVQIQLQKRKCFFNLYFFDAKYEALKGHLLMATPLPLPAWRHSRMIHWNFSVTEEKRGWVRKTCKNCSEITKSYLKLFSFDWHDSFLMLAHTCFLSVFVSHLIFPFY